MRRLAGQAVRIVVLGAALVALAATTTLDAPPLDAPPDHELTLVPPAFTWWPAPRPPVLAVGGSASIEVRDERRGGEYTATFRDGRFDVEGSGTRIRVHAGVAGDDLLVISDDDGTPWATLPVAARAAVAVRAYPLPSDVLDEILPARWAVFRGTQVGATVMVLAADGTPLIDDRMIVRGPGVYELGWDAVRFIASEPGTFELSVDVGDLRGVPLSIPVVEVIDHVEAPAPRTVTNTWARMSCFHAHGRLPDGSDALVTGAPWQYAVSGPAMLYPFSNPGCPSVVLTGSGIVTITATAAGQSASATLDVTLP